MAQNNAWNRQIVDSATLSGIGVKNIEVLREQFAGLIVFLFTISTSISNIELRIFLDTQKKRVHPIL